MHGVASQYVCDRFPPFDPDEYARVMVDLVIAGLKAAHSMGFGCSTRMATCRRAARKKWLAAEPQEALTPLIQRERHEFAGMPRPADRDDDVLFSLPEVRHRYAR